MILHSYNMANGLNPDPSQLQVNPLLNRRLKLPPIAASCNGQNNNRFSHDNFDLSSNQELSLPQIHFNSFGLQNSQTGTKTMVSQEIEEFSFSRVYTVLPPIGKKFDPRAPFEEAKVKIPNAPSSFRRSKRSTHRHRVKRQLKINEKNVSNSETVADNDSVIKTSQASPEKATESFCIDIPDFVLPTADENHAQSPPITETQNCNEKVNILNSQETKFNREKPSSVKPDAAIYTTLTNSATVADSYSDYESGIELPFPQFCTIPDDLRLYADVYPPSPPPSDKRARNMVEKTRQLIVEENGFRIEFMEDVGLRRRNATCAELDDSLKNAVKLLRDLFLRKTMEELCMLW